MDVSAERFTALYDTWYPQVLAYALTHSAPHVAEDIVSETFIVAWRRLAAVPEPALPWLLGVARNCTPAPRPDASTPAATRTVS